MTPEAEPMNVFSPRSDPESSNPFMPLHPFEAMDRGEINPAPYMLGYAEKEGSWRANYVMPDDEEGALWKEFVANKDKCEYLHVGFTTGNLSLWSCSCK
jgi:carboxylesterase type B